MDSPETKLISHSPLPEAFRPAYNASFYVPVLFDFAPGTSELRIRTDGNFEFGSSSGGIIPAYGNFDSYQNKISYFGVSS